MRFTLQALMLSVTLFCVLIAALGPEGIGVTLMILAAIIYVRTGRRARSSVWKILVAIPLIGLLISLLFPDTPRARECGRQERCAKNIETIMAALKEYHDDHGAFPPAYVCDAEGEPMHSWRVLILPYLGQEELYRQYDFTQPWNGPENMKLAAQRPEEYSCRSATWGETQEEVPYTTNYVAVVGPDTAWPGTTSLALQDIRDRDDSTIMVAEIARESGIRWMEPRDLSSDVACYGWTQRPGPSLCLAHLHLKSDQRGAHAGFVDGTTRYLREDLPASTIKALLTVNGGESVDIDRFGLFVVDSKRPIEWGRLIAAALIVLLVVLLARCKLPSSEKTEDTPDYSS